MKNLIIGIVVVLLVIGGVVWYTSSVENEITPTEGENEEIIEGDESFVTEPEPIDDIIIFDEELESESEAEEEPVEEEEL